MRCWRARKGYLIIFVFASLLYLALSDNTDTQEYPKATKELMSQIETVILYNVSYMGYGGILILKKNTSRYLVTSG